MGNGSKLHTTLPTVPDTASWFDPNCEFCQISHGLDETARIVCEAEDWVAFFPTDPATPGHTLVIPRHHVPDVWSLGPKLGTDLMSAVIKIGRAIEIALQPEGMNLISSSGAVAEQTVNHVHLHVVPRWRSDGIDRIWPPTHKMPERLKDDVADQVRAACADLDNPA